jgi:hypothetical protein
MGRWTVERREAIWGFGGRSDGDAGAEGKGPGNEMMPTPPRHQTESDGPSTVIQPQMEESGRLPPRKRQQKWLNINIGFNRELISHCLFGHILRIFAYYGVKESQKRVED